MYIHTLKFELFLYFSIIRKIQIIIFLYTDNAEQDDEQLLRQQSSSEDSSESEFVQQNCTTLSSEDTLDCPSDADSDDGMTMKV